MLDALICSITLICDVSADFWQDASLYSWYCHSTRSFYAEIHDKSKNCCWIVVAQNSFEFVRIVIVNCQILHKIVITISCVSIMSPYLTNSTDSNAQCL